MDVRLILCTILSLRIVNSVSHHPAILVISFDGFRYNYFNRNVTPTLERLKTKGTHAEYMRNVFITKTFPNHHSIATGLYPESHGVMANHFYDPVLKRVLNYTEEMWNFNNIIPIWILNEKGGNDRHSGVYMWPGSNFKYQNCSPTFIKEYNINIKWKNRVDTVIDWFLNPKTPANLVMLYFEEPDYDSHKFGPESKQVERQLERVDNITNYLYQSLADKNLLSIINVFLLSDHGMSTVTSARIINITASLDNTTYIQTSSSPALHLIPNEGQEDTIYNILKNMSQNNNFTVYRKNELLERWHYKNNIRTPTLMVVADEGYGFDDLQNPEDVTENRTYGVHGYDNALLNMHPFFMAWGPLIKEDYIIKPFDSVDLFSLFSKILALEAPKTNGSLTHVVDMLQNDSNSLSPLFVQIAGIAIVSMFLMTMAGCVTIQLLKLKQRGGTNRKAYKILDPRKPDWKESNPDQNELEVQHLLDNTEADDR